MQYTQNGWPVLPGDSPKLHTWIIPARNGAFSLRLRYGAAGFVLATFALWFSETVQRVKGATLDDWGWAPARPIPGSTDLSNHDSGTAMDLNATAHGLSLTGTFNSTQERAIHDKLRRYHGVIRWGGDYVHRKDEMHWEIVQSLHATTVQARALMLTPRGLRVLRANRGQRRIITTDTTL